MFVIGKNGDFNLISEEFEEFERYLVVVNMDVFNV